MLTMFTDTIKCPCHLRLQELNADAPLVTDTVKSPCHLRLQELKADAQHVYRYNIKEHLSPKTTGCGSSDMLQTNRKT